MADTVRSANSSKVHRLTGTKGTRFGVAHLTACGARIFILGNTGASPVDCPRCTAQP